MTESKEAQIKPMSSTSRVLDLVIPVETLTLMADMISIINDRVAFQADEDGLKVRLMDAFHIEMLSLTFARLNARWYSIAKPAVVFCVDVTELTAVVRQLKDSGVDEVELELQSLDQTEYFITKEQTFYLKEPKVQTLEVRNGQLTIKALHSEFNEEYKIETDGVLPSTKIDTGIPSLNFSTELEIPVEKLLGAVKRIQVASDYTVFTIGKDNKEMVVSGMDGTAIKARLTLKQPAQFPQYAIHIKKAEKEAQSAYDSGYMVKFLKVLETHKLAKQNILMQYSSRYPIRLAIDQALLKMVLWIAPRYETK